MKIHDVAELIMIAEQDFASAKFLTNMHPKPLENICYLCAQASEKYLKAFLEYNSIIPDKIHNLIKLVENCINVDDSFKDVMQECKIINKYKSEIRYERIVHITENDMNYVIKSVDKIKSLKVFDRIKEEIKNIDD